MKYLYYLYQLCIAIPIIIVITILTAIEVTVGTALGDGHFGGYYPGSWFGQLKLRVLLIPVGVEGRKLSSEQLAEMVRERENSGRPRICFLIGGSYGLSEKVKQLADLKLSMSDMTFPHHLARVMAAEQIYRSFKILEGSAYHK